MTYCQPCHSFEKGDLEKMYVVFIELSFSNEKSLYVCFKSKFHPRLWH